MMKTGNLTVVYGAIALLSVLLLICALFWRRKGNKFFIPLFACVSAANCGYFLLAVSDTVAGAMMANRISYLGAAFSILVMLLIIMDVCQIRRKKWVTVVLFGISTLAYGLAASGDLLGLYYRAVSIEIVNGMTVLVKEYGPLHVLYPAYLLSYFVAMIAIILQASNRRKLASTKYAAFLVFIVLFNLMVWAVEQAIDIDFEFLSVSYIITEVMLLLIYSMLQDYSIVRPDGMMVSVQMLTQMNTRKTDELPPGMEDLLGSFAEKAKTLSPAEHRILQYYIQGYDATDVPDLAHISIHTVKKHNHSIYQKLEVTSRDDLMLYIELFRCCDRLDELTNPAVLTQMSQEAEI
jgi:DNA-binding NarL/FixJ family response regulator